MKGKKTVDNSINEDESKYYIFKYAGDGDLYKFLGTVALLGDVEDCGQSYINQENVTEDGVSMPIFFVIKGNEMTYKVKFDFSENIKD